ncbi:CocE/NonD family hydrolase [Diaminobutyricibacter tongyongensis]|nr:CocE/NonD family hydrolase [Diaminobutyricibacter tongyongensis]
MPLGREEVTVQTNDGMLLNGTLTRPLATGPLPGILIRTPYGRAWMNSAAAHLASHGYAVLVQDTRTSTSYFFEARDGGATSDWMERQSWFDGNLALAGFSYLGFTAWATASTCPSSLRAMVIAEYSADRVTAWYPGGSFTLDQALTWSVQNELDGSDTPPSAEVFNQLPLSEADEAATGESLPFYQERLSFGPNSSHWDSIDYSSVAESISVPVLLFDGWYDYHRIPIFQDFERLGRAGVQRRLVFGPWTHSPLDMRRFLDETVTWFDLHIKGKGEPEAEASLFDTGANEWVDFDRWPDDMTIRTLYATSDFRLATEPQLQTTEIGWTYDPLDPTPAVGLTAFGNLEIGGPQDNRELIGRSDVIVFTTGQLEEDFLAAGRVSAHGSVRSDAPSTDFFIRVLDVGPSGAALNVCDGIRRVSGPDLNGPDGFTLEVDLGPIAHCFAKGHAIGLLIASGAHPYFDRNLGYGDSSPNASRARVAHPVIQSGGVGGFSISFSLRSDDFGSG